MKASVDPFPDPFLNKIILFLGITSGDSRQRLGDIWSRNLGDIGGHSSSDLIRLLVCPDDGRRIGRMRKVAGLKVRRGGNVRRRSGVN